MNRQLPYANTMYKRIFKFAVLVIVFAVLASCNSEASQQQQGQAVADNNSEQVTGKELQNAESPIRWHYYKDREYGMVQSRAPVPVSWTVSENPDTEIQIQDPHGLIVHKKQKEMFTYSNDPFALETARLRNMQIAPVMPLETIVQQHIRPGAEAQGYAFVKNYPLPGVKAFLENYAAKMPKTGSQMQLNILGTEWADNKGNKSFVILTQSIITQGKYVVWTIETTELEAPAAHFEEAREAYIYARANTEINPDWQRVKNGELINNINRTKAFWAAKSQESARAHQQRMAAIQSWGNTSRTIAKTYSDISDISFAGYLKRSDMISEGQRKTINAIQVRTVIGNQETSEYYNVDAGSKYYWVNNQGEYIGTDNALYDPRIDNKINDKQWTKFKVEQ